MDRVSAPRLEDSDGNGSGIIIVDVDRAGGVGMGISFEDPSHETEGVLVTYVAEGGKGAVAGIEVGDSVIAVNGHDVVGASKVQVAQLCLCNPKAQLTIRPANRCVVRCASGRLVQVKLCDLTFPVPVYTARGKEGTPKRQLVQLVSQMTDRNPQTITELVLFECKAMARLFDGSSVLRDLVYKAIQTLEQSEQQHTQSDANSGQPDALSATSSSPRYCATVPVSVGCQYQFKVQCKFTLRVHAFQGYVPVSTIEMDGSGGEMAKPSRISTTAAAAGLFPACFPNVHASSSNTRGLRLLTDGKIETGWSSLGTAFPHWIQIESPPAGRQLLMLTHRHVNGTPSKVRLRARNSKTGTSRVLRDIDLMPELLHYSYRNNAAVVLANSAELQPNETRIVVEINAVHDGSTSQGTRQTSISGFVFASCVSSSGRRDEVLPAILGMDIRPAQRTWLEGAVRTITVPAQPPCSPSNVHFSATHREEASVVLKWQAPLHDGGSGITGFKVYVEVFPSVLLQET